MTVSPPKLLWVLLKRSPAGSLFIAPPAPFLQPHRKAAWPRPVRIIVEAAKRIHNLVEGDRPLAAWRPPERGHLLDRAGVGCPRRQDCALFLPAQVRVIEYVARMFELHAPHSSLLSCSFHFITIASDGQWGNTIHATIAKLASSSKTSDGCGR